MLIILIGNMTQKEVFESITSEPKWYIGHYSQGYASQLTQRFYNGQLKQSTIRSLFEKFGYVLREESQWIKTKVEQPNIKSK